MQGNTDKPIKLTHTIYILVCPNTGAVKYVGVTTIKLKYRLSGHVLSEMNKRKREWIVGLGKPPIIIPVEKTIKEFSKKRELFYINFYTDQGYDLFNVQRNIKKNSV